MHWVAAHVHALEFMGGCPGDRGLRQPALGGDPAAPLRAGRERHLRGDGRPLRGGRHPGADLQAPGQGQGRGRGAAGRALDHRPAAQPAASTRVCRGQRGDQRMRRGDQRPAVQEDGRQRGRPCSRRWTARPFGLCPREPLRVRDLAQGQGQHRLPHRGRPRTTTRVPYQLVGQRSSRCGCRRRPSRSSSRAGGSPRTSGRYERHRLQRPTPPTCPSPTAATPSGRRARIIAWAAKTGPSTAGLVEAIMAARPHPEQGFRVRAGHHPPRPALRHRTRRGGLRAGAAPARLLLPHRRVDPARTASTASPCPSTPRLRSPPGPRQRARRRATTQ